MTYELIPPTEDFFSQQWYEKDGFPMKMMTDGLYSRIDLTRRKLIALEAKLAQRLDEDRYNPDLRSFLDRVNWLRGYIGIWTTHSDEWNAEMVYPLGIWTTHSDEWNAEMVYPLRKGHPHAKQVISQWPQNLFGERKEDKEYFLLLLSPSVITWLNRVDRWVSRIPSSTTVSV